MKYPYLAAALTLALSPSLHAHTAAPAPTAALSAKPAVTDYSTATALGGDKAYASTADGSEATFANASAQPQVTLRCTRLSRRVSILKLASGAAQFMTIWTSTQTKNAPASFNPTTN